jgi:L,D-peptidoglycan transpeptidase YkuD (ErfK/YbiS/YcfS/YnhG family)
MAVRRAPGRSSRLRRLRRLVPVILLFAVVAVCLTGPPTTRLAPAAVTVAEPSPARVLLAPISAEEQAALGAVPTDPVGRLPAVGLTPRSTAPATSAAPSPSAGSSRATSAPRATSTSTARASTRSSAAPAPAASVPAAPAPVGAGLPLGVKPPGSQVVTVVARSTSSTTARLTAWELGAGGWTAVLGPVTARIGSAGVGRASETSTKTPTGTFGLTEAFGRAGDPGTALPYRVVDGDDWWVSDSASPLYNRYTRCARGACPFTEAAGENLYDAGAVYDNAVVIDYNRGGTPGAGSAFFLHITNGAATAGCVAIDRGSLRTLLRWLDPGASPVISIGVG